jgi:AcrR family transcriptional regulator
MQRKSRGKIDTRGDLIDAAEQLFVQVGYDSTSVQSIIDAAGLSKGTFYHYFDSKQALLDAVIERMSGQMLQQIQPELDMKPLPAMDRLNLFFALTQQWHFDNLAMIKAALQVLLCDENVIIWHKMRRRSAELIAPVLAKIIAQGAEEGVFDISDARATAELLLHVQRFFGEKNAHEVFVDVDRPINMTTLMQRIELSYESMERLLGTTRGSLERPDRATIEEYVRRAGRGIRSDGAEEMTHEQ